MRFDEMNWFDVEGYLKTDDRLIIVLGACEQHGYLSLLTDVRIPQALADAASQQTGVVVAPPLNFGCSPYFLAYPGTLSLRVSTLLDVVEDIVRSVYRQGFRRLLILNGHGGNDSARSRLYELANQLPGLKIAWYAWWTAHSVIGVAEKHQLKPTHASWLENFPFTRVSDLPAEDKIPPFIPGLMGAEQARQVYGDGQFGGPYSADSEIMAQIYNAALQDIVHLLQFSIVT